MPTVALDEDSFLVKRMNRTIPHRHLRVTTASFNLPMTALRQEELAARDRFLVAMNRGIAWPLQATATSGYRYRARPAQVPWAFHAQVHGDVD